MSACPTEQRRETRAGDYRRVPSSLSNSQQHCTGTFTSQTTYTDKIQKDPAITSLTSTPPSLLPTTPSPYPLLPLTRSRRSRDRSIYIDDGQQVGTTSSPHNIPFESDQTPLTLFPPPNPLSSCSPPSSPLSSPSSPSHLPLPLSTTLRPVYQETQWKSAASMSAGRMDRKRSEVSTSVECVCRSSIVLDVCG